MNAPAKIVTLQLGEASITVPGEVAAMAYLEKLLEESRPVPVVREATAADRIPAIGAAYRGGIFAGLTVHDNEVFELVLLPGEESATWNDALAWAEKQGGMLPSRVDQLVLFKNLKSEFKEAWYWSGAQCAGYESFAWCQYFDFGSQGYDHKDYKFRARAVRRLPIQ